MKETFKTPGKKEEPPGKKEETPEARKTITPYGAAALILAATGFGLSWYSTHQARQGAAIQKKTDEDHRSYIKSALDKELPGAFSQAITNSQKELNDSFSKAVDHSKQGLETAIDKATQKSSAEVQAAIQSSGKAVADNLATAISQSQERINATVGETEKKVNASIKNAETGISKVVKESDDEIRKSVTGAVKDSGDAITTVISEAVKKQTQTIGEMAEHAVGEQIMQIPLRIDQHQRGRLGGPLSNFIVKVGDVSKNQPFDVTVSQENGKFSLTKTIEPTKTTTRRPASEKEWQTIDFTHDNNSYRLEITVQTQRNLFGTGLDYVVVRAVKASSTARK